MECIRIRIKDVDFGHKIFFVRGGKGEKDRTTLLPGDIREELKIQIDRVKGLHHQDLEEGFGEVYIPEALGRKYPNAARESRWQKEVRRSKIRPRDASSCDGIRIAEGGETGSKRGHI